MPDQEFEQIVQESKAARASLATMIAEIEDDIAEIQDVEWERDLTTEELGQLKKLNTLRSTVMGAVAELGFVTLTALDKSDGIKRIRNALQRTVSELDAEKKDLEQIAKRIGGFTQKLDAVKKIADKVVDKVK